MRGFLRRLSRVQRVGMRDRSEELSRLSFFFFFSFFHDFVIRSPGRLHRRREEKGERNPEKSVPAAMDGPTVAAVAYLVRPRASTRHTVHVAYVLIADLCRKNKTNKQTKEKGDMGRIRFPGKASARMHTYDPCTAASRRRPSFCEARRRARWG